MMCAYPSASMSRYNGRAEGGKRVILCLTSISTVYKNALIAPDWGDTGIAYSYYNPPTVDTLEDLFFLLFMSLFFTMVTSIHPGRTPNGTSISCPQVVT